jgi:hypothetical protein
MKWLGALFGGVVISLALAVSAQHDIGGGGGGHDIQEGSAVLADGTVQQDIDLNTNSKQVILDAGTANDPAIVFGDDDDGTGTGIYRSGTDGFWIGAGGGGVAKFNPTWIDFYKPLDINGQYIYDNGDQLDLGGACTDGHSMGTGAVCIAGDSQFDGAVYFDSTSTFVGTPSLPPTINVMTTGGGGTNAFRWAYDSSDGYFHLVDEGATRSNGNLIIAGFNNRDLISNLTAPDASSTNVQLWVFSSTVWSSAVDEYLHIEHDTTDPVYTSGKGDHKFNDDGGKGVASFIRTKTESVTFAADPGDASKVTTGSIITDGAFVTAVTTRTTTAATNCTDVDVGIAGTDVDMFADGTAIAANTTTTNADANSGADWGASIQPSFSAQEITVTANGANCFNGVWAITVHYLDASAATSN